MNIHAKTCTLPSAHSVLLYQNYEKCTVVFIEISEKEKIMLVLKGNQVLDRNLAQHTCFYNPLSLILSEAQMLTKIHAETCILPSAYRRDGHIF